MSRIHPAAADWDGIRTATRARSTGTLVGLQPSEDPDAGKWQLVCNEHGGVICFDTQAVARSYMAHPDEWCPGCQEKEQ